MRRDEDGREALDDEYMDDAGAELLDETDEVVEEDDEG